MSKDEIPVCLGQPAERLNGGAIETWIYNYGTCSLRLAITPDGLVKATTLTIKAAKDYKPDETPLTEDEQCAKLPEVASCVRWLRR